MSSEKPYFNPSLMSNTNEIEEKKAEKKPKKEKKVKKEKEVNTRSIRFARRTVGNWLSFFFFTLFIIQSVVLIMYFNRLDIIADVANSKKIDPTEIVTDVQKTVLQADQIKYEGQNFLETLINYSVDTDKQKEREEKLTSYLPAGMRANELGIRDSKFDRVLNHVNFVKLKEDKSIELENAYLLYYDISFTENSQLTRAQVIVPVQYKNQKLTVLNKLSLTNLTVVEHDEQALIDYKQERFFSKGTAVTTEEETKIQNFLNQFFELYVTNDSKLELISNVQGLSDGELIEVTLKNAVKTKNDMYLVEGTYSFKYGEGASFDSFFSIELKQNKDSYFVTKFNE